MLNHIDPKKVFVVVPAYNEDTVIRQVISDLLLRQYNVIVVDDGSVKPVSLQLGELPVHILRHPVNLGQGAALQTGIEYAVSKKAGYVVTFDGDGQHSPDDIDKLLAPLISGEADITLGSRFMKGSVHNMSSGRKKTIQMARLINYIFTGLKLSDAYNGMRAFNHSTAAMMRLQENGMAHATEILAFVKKRSLNYKEIPVSIRYTDYSKSKGLTVWNGFRIFFDILLNKIFK